ncbi:MAG: hypothetical protein GXP26_00040 [Planctomycetes bacterium]|nr:hypothetical protein [Planctomycetota bacterium]
MTLVVQIVLALALLAGLIAPFIGNKTWHWTQLALVVCIELAGVGFLFLAAETVRVHYVLRAKIPKLETDLVAANERHENLIHGAGDTQGVLDFEHRLQIIARDRGRVWNQVMPASEVDNEGRVEVEITQPQPHGLAEGSIIFAFESNEALAALPSDPNDPSSLEDTSEPPVPAADDSTNKQYLGEFRVIEANETGVVLEPVLLINQRTGRRLAESLGPWSLHETMPADRHSIFASMTEEELRQLMPAETIEEYIRHGTPATPDDDKFERVGLDENDERVGPDDLDKAVKFLYDRPLRDYAYLFAELAQQRVLLQTRILATTEDNAKIVESIKSAERLGKFRQKQKQLLAIDLEGMQQDRKAIEAHRDKVIRMLTNARQLIDQTLAKNTGMAKELTKRQLNRLQLANINTPAPAGAETPTP